ncbi:coiled-coil domain-containing protein 80 [Neosynchiropus ocellatus]
MKLHCPPLLFAALWSISCPRFLTAWPSRFHSKPKDQLDPNVRDWGDYSDLPTGIELGLGLDEEQDHGNHRGAGQLFPTLAPELDFMADFGGKKRLWLIAAPSHNDHYLQMMEKQLEDMEQKGLNCQLAERDTFIIIIIQNAMMEGRIQKTTMQGDATVETLDPDTVTKLLHYFDLTEQEQAFSMLVVKKNLHVSERFPYPVRVEAIFDLIDQMPKRRLEKIARKGASLRCKTFKKVVVKRKKMVKKKIVLSPQRQGNITSVVMLPHKRPADKKAALKNKIQDILSGRSRFVIRKEPSVGSSKGQGASNGGQGERGKHDSSNSPPVSKNKEEEKKDSHDSKMDHVKNGSEKGADKVKDDKQGSKKKGKGKKGRKGKGRGKKSSREASETDKAALKEFLNKFRGTRRLMVISTPSRDATLYIQQEQENEKQQCELAKRRVTVATIVGQDSDTTLTLHHYQMESEPLLDDQPRQLSDSGLISLLRAELGLSSPDLFSMTVTDYDIKRERVFEAPPSTQALFEYVDSFPSRRSDREKEGKSAAICIGDKQHPKVENSLTRFMSKRRLLLVSSPSEDDYSFQQQLLALRGQECHLGIRHFAMLKLTGTGDKASGSVEQFPLNGRSQSEVEPLSRDAVNNLREQLKISKEYFSMLVVGKDGDVKAWFPSPMWSLDNIYDLVDSMELRIQEEQLQKRLGISCPEDRSRGGTDGGH